MQFVSNLGDSRFYPQHGQESSKMSNTFKEKIVDQGTRCKQNTVIHCAKCNNKFTMVFVDLGINCNKSRDM